MNSPGPWRGAGLLNVPRRSWPSDRVRDLLSGPPQTFRTSRIETCGLRMREIFTVVFGVIRYLRQWRYWSCTRRLIARSAVHRIAGSFQVLISIPLFHRKSGRSWLSLIQGIIPCGWQTSVLAICSHEVKLMLNRYELNRFQRNPRKPLFLPWASGTLDSAGIDEWLGSRSKSP